MTNKKVVWLEDVPSTLGDLVEYCRKKGYEIIIENSIAGFAQTLKDYKGNIALIVLDIMIMGTYDLGDIGYKDIKTEGGYETGFQILEHFLRVEDSPYKYIAVLILSIRPLKEEYETLIDKLRKYAPIEYVEKHVGDWQTVFKEKFDQLVKQNVQ